MKFSNVYKVVFMENVKTSDLVFCRFIKAESNSALEKYAANTDCKILYVSRLEDWEVEFVAFDELVNGEMKYHD